MSAPARHVEAERTIVFGEGALSGSADLLGSRYTLLSTPRARAAAPPVERLAERVVNVPDGLVEDVAARLRPHVTGDRLVALGGGRVIDVAKALAAADPPRAVVAIPTSLSGAEMTGAHRHAAGVPADAPRVRPAVVLNDPRLSASQPLRQLAASSANALGHATVGLLSSRATPISRAVAREAIDRLVAGWWPAPEADRERIALGAMLAGWAVDHSGLGPHHALAQTLARAAGLSHAEANAAVLPESVRALRRRRPAELERLDAQLGVELETVAERLREIAGLRVGDGGSADADLLDHVVETAFRRPELQRVEPAPDHTEVREILAAAAATGRSAR